MRRSFLSDEAKRQIASSSERHRVHDKRRQRTHRLFLESLESRCLLANITPYTIPLSSGVQPDPVGITVAAGNLWFTDQTANGIGMLTPSDPTAIQTYSQGLSGAPVDIITGPDGNAWFTESSGSTIGIITTSGSTHPIQEFTLPGNEEASSLARGNSVVWYIDPNTGAIGSINSSSHSPNAEIPLGKDQNGNSLIGFGFTSQIVVGTDADSTLWFTEYNSTTNQGAIASYNPTTKAWSQYMLTSGQIPYGLAVGPGGNIWFSEAVPDASNPTFDSSALGMINTSSSPPGSPVEYAIPTTSNGAVLPYQIVQGPDSNIWYIGNNLSTIGMYNPTTREFAIRKLPQATGESPPQLPRDHGRAGPEPIRISGLPTTSAQWTSSFWLLSLSSRLLR